MYQRRQFLRLGIVVMSMTSGLCLAQSNNPQYLVMVTQVKPDMLNEWMDIQKNEINPALKKAGIKQRTVSGTLLGNTYEYVSVTPITTMGIFDGQNVIAQAVGPEAAARMLTKLRKCVVSTRTYSLTRLADLSAPPDSPGPITVITRRRVAAGKRQEYEAYIKNDILPLYKKAKAEGKVLGYTVSARGLGSFGNEIGSSVSLAKAADLDKGPALTQMLGREGAAKVAAKGAGLTTVIETVVRQRIADLSF